MPHKELKDLYSYAAEKREALTNLIDLSIEQAGNATRQARLHSQRAKAMDEWQNAIGKYYYMKAKEEISAKGNPEP